MSATLFWVITQRIVVIPYGRFGTTCRSHLKGQIGKSKFHVASIKLYRTYACDIRSDALAGNMHNKLHVSASVFRSDPTRKQSA